MDFVNGPLLAAAALVFFSVLAGVYSTRAGFSFLLVFLLAGGLAGEDGPGGIRFSDFRLSFWVGNLALAVILLDGGLKTSFSTFRTGLRPALVLATVGVVASALLTGALGVLLLGLEWQLALLIGAVVGSTDAAAVFALLRRSGVTLNERVATTLEIESGMNDPMAVYLTLAFIALIVAAGTEASSPQAVAWSLVQQFGLGALAGIGGGFVLAAILKRLPHQDPGGGIPALLITSAGLALFAATGLLGGSGFLAAYLLGLVVANRASEEVANAQGAMDGYAWLSQAGMFLLMGLLVTPSAMVDTAGTALALAAVLMFIARPAVVWLCLLPFRYPQREVAYIAWVGLRGAVPIVLAVFPLMAGVPNGMLVFNVAFVVVLASLVLQGTTIAFAARKLGVALPEREDEPRVRALFGDFTLDADAPVESVCSFYGLPLPEHAEVSLGEWVTQSLGRPAVVGDRLRIGPATVSVRAMDGARVTAVGLKLEE